MISLFDRIEITRMQFQENDSEVLVNCSIVQQGIEFESTLWISFSDLNRLLAKMNQLEFDTAEKDLFVRIPMGQNGNWFEFESKRFGAQSFVLENVSFQENIRQIRA
jgi:hypothetical protein